MELFFVVDKMMLGCSTVAAFRTYDKAEEYMQNFKKKSNIACDIERHFVIGSTETAPDKVYAAHIYDSGKDIHVLREVYIDKNSARSCAGDKGQIIELVPDVPTKNQIFLNH